ncbi:hypothetical protein niasHT_031284 [Heterodera trifolii]|uniref:Uncharacterized protein n=1 Tax=Heterodera trifolii TaxID=157864 RepID=A0ABD2ISF9_9BILA
MFPPLPYYIARRCSAASSSSSSSPIALLSAASPPTLRPPALANARPPHHPQQQGLAEKAGTTVLLLHGGEPRTNFYARAHLGRVLIDRLAVPNWVGMLIADFYFACSAFPARCIADSVHFPQNVDQLNWLRLRLERALALLLPEFGPFRCLPATGQAEDQTNVGRQLHSAIRHGIDNLLLLPLQPQCRTRPLLAAIRKAIGAMANQTQCQQKQAERTRGFVCARQFVVRNSPVSFSLLIADDQIAWTHCFVQYCVERILPLFADYGAIIFTAVRPTPVEQLEPAARRVMHALYRHSPLATPWRCAVHYAWDQPFCHWVDRLALMRWRRHTLAHCVHRLRRKGIAGPLLVVPLDSMMEDFDVHTTLPALIAALRVTTNSSSRSNNVVHLLPTRPLAEDTALVHSLAEFVKYVMLNPQKFCLSTPTDGPKNE